MLHILRMGCNARHDPDFILEAEHGWGCHILLLVKTRAFFHFGGKKKARTLVQPGTVVLFDQKDPFYYGAAGESYINDWIMFKADESVMHHRGLSFSTPLAMEGRYPVSQLFGFISDAFYSESPLSPHISSHLLHALIDMVAESSQAETPDSAYFPAFLELRKRIYESPLENWKIPLIARDLDLSSGYFQALYKQLFGTTCMRDVIQSRIEMAGEMLQTGNLSVKEIGFACGYASQVHFSRQFKSSTGLTPLEYRMKSRWHMEAKSD